MKNRKALILFIGVLCIVGFFEWKRMDSEDQPPSSQRLPLRPPEGQSTIPKIKYPIATNDSEASQKNDPIPKLDESDKSIQQKAQGFFGKLNLEDVINFEDFIRHFVVAMENATGKQIPVNMSPIKTATGELIVRDSGNGLILGQKNFNRYQHYMDFIQSADLNKIVAYYRRAYPLFQKAYEELGTQGYFNDKFIEVIDNILQTPETEGPIRLKQQSVRYEFADPDLESLSAIQKIVLRMGPNNAHYLKKRVRELRQLLIESTK